MTSEDANPMRPLAVLMRQFYDALIDEGFPPDHAASICGVQASMSLDRILAPHDPPANRAARRARA